jgi:hypothetical protein
MTEPPFGFGPGRNSGDDPDVPGGSGGSGPGGGGPVGPFGGMGPLGPMGDPQQFADALRQFADLMSWQGGPVNWDLAKNIARQTVAQKGDASVLDIDRSKVIEALRLADLWLEDATEFPSGIRTSQAWSRSEWVEATLPVWSKLCDPIAARAVDAMSGLLGDDPAELGADIPPEMQAMLGGLGGLGGLGEMMRRIGGMMVGGQTGAAVGALAEEVVSSTDVGLPLGPQGTACPSTPTRSGSSSRCARLPITACSATCRGCGPDCSARSRTTRAGSPSMPLHSATRCRRSIRPIPRR